MAPSMSHGAVNPLQRRPAMNVWLSQWPNGTAPGSRSPIVAFQNLAFAHHAVRRWPGLACFANAVPDEPRCLVADAKHVLHLLGRNTLLAGGEQTDCHCPFG